MTFYNQHSTSLAGASGQGGYNIERSLRFRSSATGSLTRTITSSGNRKTWTWSSWVKRGKFADYMMMFNTGQNTSGVLKIMIIRFNNNDTLSVIDEDNAVGNSFFLTTTAVYRDPSSWYHIVVAYDSTQGTASNRLKIYVNGVQVTSFSTSTYPPLNYDSFVNYATYPYYGISDRINVSGQTFDGYQTEMNFIDGQALDPSYFGETDTDTGVWKPKRYAGTYGTNGFYLNFSDNTSTTTLGYDQSSNSNNWTCNNISLTAGSTYDSMQDVPTLTSADAGNFATLNPLNKGTNQTIANGNLRNTASGHGTVLSSIGVTSGLWYGESTLTVSGVGGIGFTSNQAAESSYGELAGKWWCYDNGAGFYIINQNLGATASLATKFSAGQVWQWAIDNNNGKVWIGLNNSWFSSTGSTTGDPATGANPTFTFTAGTLIWPFLENAGGPTWDVNFGQRPFAYTPPTGYKALNTYNLPDPTVKDGSDYFNTVLYTGNASSSRDITGVGFQPDFVWFKERSVTRFHRVFDAVRGTGKKLYTNDTSAELTTTTELNSFLPDGFNIGSDAGVNENGQTYVAWNWKANGSGSSNTDGSITSTVSANTSSGFSVVTYTGTGSTATVGHGLGIAPQMAIFKSRSAASSWWTYHVGLSGSTYAIELNSTSAEFVSGSPPNWNISSSTLGISGSSPINASGQTFVCYAFAPVEGFSAFGKYTGNGSADGPFVYTGFRPAFVLIKLSAGSTESWTINDTTRNPYNVSDAILTPNTSDAEGVGSGAYIDFDSNGFKIRNNNPRNNGSGYTYIYAAFAENPFKYSLAR